ncbi:MAG: tetratricopeptide repeat protein, partial [Candidatus Gastranaerophilaceae bacterium]
YEEAVTFVEKAVKINPTSYFYLNLGTIYMEKGDVDNAAVAFENALSLEKKDPKIFFGIAQCYKIKNDSDKAIEFYRKAIELNPSYYEALSNLANSHLGKKEVDKAIESYKAALEINQGDAEICHILGNIYLNKFLTDVALFYLEKAIRLKPHKVEYYTSYAAALKVINKKDEAVEFFQIAIELDPQNYKTYVGLGSLYIDMKKYDEAIECCQNALNLNPDDPNLLQNLAIAFEKKGDMENLINLYNKILKFNINNHKIYVTLSNVYFKMEDFDKAIEYSHKALKLKPDFAEAYLNMGNAYKYKKDIKTAINCFKRAFELNPDFADAHFNFATTQLLNGNFEKGFKEYEWRFKRNLKIHAEIKTDKPVWDGSSLENKTILVCYEQGFGDSLQFARYLPLLTKMGAKVLVKTQSTLEKLFEQSDLKAEVVKTKKLKDLPYFDTYTFFMSLPYLFKTNIDNIPFSEGYLKADPEKVAHYKEKYFNNNNFKVGIKWQGNPDGSKSRQVPLEAFYQLADIPNIKLYSLQKGDGIEALENVPENIEIVSLGETFNDFDDTAAAIENLDLVLCNDTSVVHLAAALGKPTWILLTYVCEWRWLLGTDTSKWYDSVRLFRQNKVDNWDNLIGRVKTELMTLSKVGIKR